MACVSATAAFEAAFLRWAKRHFVSYRGSATAERYDNDTALGARKTAQTADTRPAIEAVMPAVERLPPLGSDNAE